MDVRDIFAAGVRAEAHRGCGVGVAESVLNAHTLEHLTGALSAMFSPVFGDFST